MRLLCLALSALLLSCTPTEEAPTLTYRDSGGFFTKPVVGSDNTIYVGSLSKCFYAFDPDGSVKWRYPAGGEILSNPTMDRSGNLYFGSKNNYVHSVDKDGNLRWRHKVKGAVEAGSALGLSDTVYFATMKGFVYAYTPDGVEKWSLKMPKGSTRVKFTPVVLGSHIIVGSEKGTKKSSGLILIKDNGPTGQVVNTLGQGGAFRIGGVTEGLILYTSEYNEIMAVRTDLSKKVWGFPLKQVHRSHPVLSPDGKTLYQGSREDGHLYALDALTGAKLWATDLTNSLVMTPAVDPIRGTIFIGQAAGGPFFFAINPDGTEKWRHDTSHSLRSTPALSRDLKTVYSGGNVGGFFALDTETGEEKWVTEIGSDKSICKKMKK